MTTLIEGSYIVAHDGSDHRIIRNGVVAYEGNEVKYVGKQFSGVVDSRVDARGKLVIPGLISMHTHASIPACERLLPDVGRRDFFGSGVFNCIPAAGAPGGLEEEEPIGVKFALADALLHGCTTVVEVGRIGNDELLRIVGESGVRAYVGPGFRSAKWSITRDGRFEYIWDDEKGFKDLGQAVEFIKKNQGAYNGKISGMLYPMQADTCTPELLKKTKEESNKLGVKIQIHAAQNLIDFHETLRRYKKTPIRFLSDAGILDQNLVIAHCIFISGHSWTAYPEDSDLRLLAASGATVAHCPLVYARRGIRLESYQRYINAGVNVTIGMDTYPRDMISEMRLASLISKVVDQDYGSASSADIFRSATLRAAKALGRTDIGRISKGAKADIAIVNLERMHIGPIVDPIRTLVNCATGQDVDTVIVDGEILVADGRLTKVDQDALIRDVSRAAERVWADVPRWHWAGLRTDQICPSSFQEWES